MYYDTAYRGKYGEDTVGLLSKTAFCITADGQKERITMKSYTSAFTDIPVMVDCNIIDTLINTRLTHNTEQYYIYLEL